ncbi:MAG: hypothetical protein V1723_03395 [Candidatus Uhrbacteria bacterium]
MNLSADVIASPDVKVGVNSAKQSRPSTGLPRPPMAIGVLAMTSRMVASELLSVLLFLYPLALIFDWLEPGFVRSVFNPHLLLLAIIAVAIIASVDIN